MPESKVKVGMVYVCVVFGCVKVVIGVVFRMPRKQWMWCLCHANVF